MGSVRASEEGGGVCSIILKISDWDLDLLLEAGKTRAKYVSTVIHYLCTPWVHIQVSIITLSKEYRIFHQTDTKG